jgi:acyl carrier protein
MVSKAMEDREILETISEIARRHLQWSGSLEPSQRLVEALALESIRLLTLVVELENHFKICLDEQDEAGLTTVGDLVAAIRSKLA